MFAWGNQSCGRLGLQEKKMEKALASAVRNAQGVLKIVCAKDCRVLFGKWLIEIWIHWTLHKERGVVCQLHILENPVRVFPLEDFERDWNTG